MPALRLHGKNGARFHGHIIDHHRACPAGDRLAAPFGSGKTNVVPDCFDKKGLGVYVKLVFLVIHC